MEWVYFIFLLFFLPSPHVLKQTTKQDVLDLPSTYRADLEMIGLFATQT